MGIAFSELFALAVCLALYLIPYGVAQGRRHEDRDAILALNLLLGWTLLGWVVALIWSFMGEHSAAA